MTHCFLQGLRLTRNDNFLPSQATMDQLLANVMNAHANQEPVFELMIQPQLPGGGIEEDINDEAGELNAPNNQGGVDFLGDVHVCRAWCVVEVFIFILRCTIFYHFFFFCEYKILVISRMVMLASFISLLVCLKKSLLKWELLPQLFSQLMTES